MKSVYSPSIDPSIQPSVHSCAAVCIHHASESITWFHHSIECHRRPCTSETVNPEKLLLIVMTDRKHYKTINKTTNKNGLRAIKPRQRPNRSPTNYLYTKPSNLSTHPQSIRRFNRPSTRVQPYVYTMHQNPSRDFARVQNVIAANHRNTVNPEKLLLIVMTDGKHYKTINKTTNKNGLRAIKPRQRPNSSPTSYLYRLTKPSNQSTHPQSIRRFSRPSTRVQPYVYTMHQNPSRGFARV